MGNHWRTSRAIPGGVRQSPGSPHAQGTPRVFLFPSGSILPADPPLERGKFSQALFDIGAVLAAFILASLTGFAIVFSVFLLMFVRL